MYKLAGAFCLLLAACATGRAGARLDLDADACRTSPGSHAPAFELTALDLSRNTSASADRQLPRTDRVAYQLRDQLGDVVSTELRLCVAPDGRVRRVDVVRGTRLVELDDAMVQDVSDWQFPSHVAGNAENCQLATIQYRPHP